MTCYNDLRLTCLLNSMTLLSLTDEINKNQKEKKTKKQQPRIQESGKTLTCIIVFNTTYNVSFNYTVI